MTLKPGQRLGGYEIVSSLGAGGMGEVYRARDPKLDRDVAIKVLPEDVLSDPGRRGRLAQEAKVLASLNHPNVAAIYGVEDSTDRMALVMELIDGAPLSERIPLHGLPLDAALGLAAQIARGLAAAHKVGVVHRDLKPANVLITKTGAVKLIDFGIARLMETTLTDNTTRTAPAYPMTEAGQILGTVAYMSPEQARGDSLDPRSDLFAFGTLLYEMLTGQRPFLGADKPSTLAAIIHSEPRPLSDVAARPLPREVERLVLRCLRKDPERRVQSASDLALALEDLGSEGLVGTRSPTGEAAWRTRALLAGSALVFLAVAGLSLWWPGRDRGPAETLRQLTFEAGVAITPAISPDGKLLAYATDRSGEGQLDIWLKQIAGGEPVRLTSGPDTKVNPQFSPDGTRILFLDGRNVIREVPALGGATRKIIDAAGPFTVSSGGAIAFHHPGTGTTPGPMFVLDSGATSPQPWRPECMASATAWSPDGLNLAFLGNCRGSGAELRGAFVSPRVGGTVERLAEIPSSTQGPRLTWVRTAAGAEFLVTPRQAGDSINLVRLTLKGDVEPFTSGTGLHSWPVVSPTGDLIHVRTEQTPSVWSLPIVRDGSAPKKEASPARMFGTTPDGSRLVFGRMVGVQQGELVLRDRLNGGETVLASHTVAPLGGGSFWPQVSPDGRRVIYRVFVPPNDISNYLVSVEGGAPRRLESSRDLNVASDWSPDGRRVIAECIPLQRGICELDPDSDTVRTILTDPAGGALLYPSFSWDGAWVAFSLRRAGKTSVVMTVVRPDGTLSGESAWVTASPPDAEGLRPRFSPDGSSLFYELIRGGVVALVNQRLDAQTRPVGEPTSLAALQNMPPGVFNIGLQIVITVTRDRVFFNTAEVRSNVWVSRIE